MATYTQLQARVNSNVIDAPAAVQTNIPVFVNAVLQAAQALHNFNCMKAEIQGVLTTAATHTLMQTPQGFKEPRGTPYWLSADGTVNAFDWAPNRSYVYRQWNTDKSTSTGPPKLLGFGESVTVNASGTVTASSALGAGMPLLLYPYSVGAGRGAGGQYPISIPYWATLPDLTNAADTNWFATYMTEYVVAAATAMAFEMDWDDGANQPNEKMGGRAGYWRTLAYGPKFDGTTLDTVGGWFRIGFELDKRLGYAPVRSGV